MACLLFSTVKINFMPQFIPVFAASKAFKSYLAAWLCSVPRLRSPFGSPVSAGFEQTWLILYATSATGSKAPLSALFQRLDLPLWDRVLSVWNTCFVGEKGSATRPSRKRRAKWHLVPSFRRDGVSFAPIAGLALAVFQGENFLTLQQTEKFLQDASQPWARLESTQVILHQLRRLQRPFFCILMKYNKCRRCWCTSEVPVPLVKVFI